MANVTRYYEPEGTKYKKIKITGTHAEVDTIEKIFKDWIWPSTTGRAVMREIFRSPAGTELSINATGGNAPSAALAFDDNDAFANKVAAVGTGKGTSSILQFNPKTPIPSSLCSGDCKDPRFNLPRFVLFHEVVHSMRQMNGKVQFKSTNLSKTSTKLEEVIAIVVTNTFMSEKGDNTLRADHKSLATTDIATFSKDPGVVESVKQLKIDHPTMASTIALVGTTKFPFNPFA